jgi:hypothetical protein
MTSPWKETDTMAVFEDLFKSWTGTGLAGLGLILAAPIVLPVVGTVVRPVAKGLIWGAHAVTFSGLPTLA